MEGLSASVDYYNIYVTNAIAVPNAQQVVNGCFAGITAFCPDIVRSGAVTPKVRLRPLKPRPRAAPGGNCSICCAAVEICGPAPSAGDQDS